MAQDFTHNSPVGTYTPYPINATRSSALLDSSHSHGTFLGTLVVGTQGTGDVITLKDGSGGTAFTLTNPPIGTYIFNTKYNSGLFVTVTGTAGSYCFNARPMAI